MIAILAAALVSLTPQELGRVIDEDVLGVYNKTLESDATLFKRNAAIGYAAETSRENACREAEEEFTLAGQLYGDVDDGKILVMVPDLVIKLNPEAKGYVVYKMTPEELGVVRSRARQLEFSARSKKVHCGS